MGDCPCGSSRPVAECCGPFLSGLQHPETALGLMRSRYAAYCLQDGAYLLKTWHPQSRPATLEFRGEDTEWLALAIVSHASGGAGDDQGVVEFIATYRQGGRLRRFRESSRFLRESGIWFYVDGVVQSEPQPGRNDPCWCGSGRKHKKCCG